MILGSWNFIDYKDKLKHQKTIDEFFLKNNRSKICFDNIFYLNSDIGERTLKLLGSNEKDYHFYGDSFWNSSVVEKIINFSIKNKVDSISIPLLSREGSDYVKDLFLKNNDEFLCTNYISSITPIIRRDKDLVEKYSLKRKLREFEKKGFYFEKNISFNHRIKKLHHDRWGNNRDEEFFKFLEYCNKNELSENFAMYDSDKNLVAYIQNMKTGNVIHYYYSIYNQNINGAGLAIISFAISNFIKDNKYNIFSFGRGAERYKFRWSNDFICNYKLDLYYKGDL